jgi:hypothetical protein
VLPLQVAVGEAAQLGVGVGNERVCLRVAGHVSGLWPPHIIRATGARLLTQAEIKELRSEK